MQDFIPKICSCFEKAYHEFLGFVVDLTNIFCIEAFLSHSVPQIGIQINSQYHLTQGHSTRDDTIPPEAVEARDLTT